MREGCHLCEAFIEELETFGANYPIQLQIQDVDSNEEWIERYGDRVPALVIDGQLVCEYFFDPDKVSPYFRDEK